MPSIIVSVCCMGHLMRGFILYQCCEVSPPEITVYFPYFNTCYFYFMCVYGNFEECVTNMQSLEIESYNQSYCQQAKVFSSHRFAIASQLAGEATHFFIHENACWLACQPAFFERGSAGLQALIIQCFVESHAFSKFQWSLSKEDHINGFQTIKYDGQPSVIYCMRANHVVTSHCFDGVNHFATLQQFLVWNSATNVASLELYIRIQCSGAKLP